VIEKRHTQIGFHAEIREKTIDERLMAASKNRSEPIYAIGSSISDDRGYYYGAWCGDTHTDEQIHEVCQRVVSLSPDTRHTNKSRVLITS